MYADTRSGDLPKLFRVIILSLVLSIVGIYLGQFIPPIMLIPLAIVEIGLLIAVIFLRKKKTIGYSLMSAFFLVSGATLSYSLSYYVQQLGSAVVLQAFAVTVIAFSAIAIYAVKTKQNFSYLGGFLFGGLIALVGIGILNIFIPFGGMMEIIYACGGILIFIGYSLYDINKIAKEGFTDDEIPIIAINIWLDFVNLFLFILRLFTGFKKN
jgi:FtsH-binding integral membrane protein